MLRGPKQINFPVLFQTTKGLSQNEAIRKQLFQVLALVVKFLFLHHNIQWATCKCALLTSPAGYYYCQSSAKMALLLLFSPLQWQNGQYFGSNWKGT